MTNDTNQPILILTAQTGGGHVSIAKAIESIINRNFLNQKVVIYNTSPKAAEWVYRYIGNQFSSPFATFWDWSNTKEKAEVLSQLYALSANSTIEKLIKTNNPKLIISTEPFTIQSVQQVLKKAKLKIPHCIYIADPFSIHELWTTGGKHVSYLSPTQEATKIIKERLGNEVDVTTTGFILRPNFYTNPKFKQGKKYTVFIGGNGEGGGDIVKFVRAICHDQVLCKKAKLIIACGKNNLIKTQLTLSPYINNIPHQILGFTPNIHHHLAKCDLVIGKPGPNLLFESIMYEKPFIATGDPLSQEIGNYLFIESSGIGYVTTNTRLAIAKIKYLMTNNPSLLQTNIKIIKKSHIQAPKKIVSYLGKYL